MVDFIEKFIKDTRSVPAYAPFGRVVSAHGLLVEASGVQSEVSVGDYLEIQGHHGMVPAEVVGFREGRALMIPCGALEHICLGAKTTLGGGPLTVAPDDAWLGRVCDAMAEPLDNRGPLTSGVKRMAVRASPPPAHVRGRLGDKLDLGVLCINAFTSCCVGQRMGIFSSAGVGKSILMSMMARYSSADVIVVGLIGERGREVTEFIEDDLGPEGLARSVVVVSTSDEPPLMRRQAAYLTMTIAEYFRDQGMHVLCLIDSLTRFAMAQREIGLSAGEPPTNRGYTPSVFSDLPKLLERAGPGPKGTGSITGLFTVLVEGDDHNEPIADSLRGVLDGHIVLERAIAERGRYPAMNVPRSVSRTMPQCNTAEQNSIIEACRKIISTYEDMSEMIRLGAYQAGNSPEVDQAIRLYPRIESVLRQGKTERKTLDDAYAALATAIADGAPDQTP